MTSRKTPARVTAKSATVATDRWVGASVLTALLTVVWLVTLGWLPAQGKDISPELKEIGTANGKVAAFDYGSNALRVDVWVDRDEGEVYGKGEDLGVGFQTNQDAYAVVYRIGTEGLVTVLWPRSRFDDGFVFGVHEYDLPVASSRKLRVSTKEGQGVVEAIVSSYPFDLRSLEVDFHHEHTADRYEFYVAGDPFLAINEVNYAITGLEDAAEYVVTGYVDYYVHQTVDHPRYLCKQCHLNDDSSHRPYRDECVLDIQSDYSWYNGWYDRYGYYPVYGNPVYAYIDPWTYNPWVNYWYEPAYYSAPWFDWGWGWGVSYNWGYSPYYWGDSVTAYAGGYRRYRPLDRTRLTGTSGVRTKTREYQRGSQMVGNGTLDQGARAAMVSRTRVNRSATATENGRGGGRYRGEASANHPRGHYDQVASRGRPQAGLRIRQPQNGSRSSSSVVPRQRHTAAGGGRSAVLAPVSRHRIDSAAGRGTVRGRNAAPVTVGNRRSAGSSGSNHSAVTKPPQTRRHTTRVWHTNRRTNRGASRSRGGAVGERRRTPDEQGSIDKPRRQNDGRSEQKGGHKNQKQTKQKTSSKVQRSRGSQTPPPVPHRSSSSGRSAGGRSRSGDSRR